jgi:hypothetical protein
MKTNHFMVLTMLLLAVASHRTQAQVPGLPNPSPTQTIDQEIGLGHAIVTYSRPNVKDRKIFGGLVPFGTVWRTGANTATEITFSEDVKLDGHNVPAGTYSLFTIPEKDQWTIIVNKAVKEWGAYSYKPEDDLLRFIVKPAHINDKHETFTIRFANSTTSSADLQIVWDYTVVSIRVTVDDDAKITATIEELMKAEHNSNLVYFNAIQYYYNNNKDADKALGWIKKAKADVPTNPAYPLFESRFLLRKGDKAGAVAAAEAGIKVAKERKFDEYIKLLSEALAQAKGR